MRALASHTTSTRLFVQQLAKVSRIKYTSKLRLLWEEDFYGRKLSMMLFWGTNGLFYAKRKQCQRKLWPLFYWRYSTHRNVYHSVNYLHVIYGAVCFQLNHFSWRLWFVLHLIIVLLSEIWIISHCLRLGHKTMASDVCLAMFFLSLFGINRQLKDEFRLSSIWYSPYMTPFVKSCLHLAKFVCDLWADLPWV